MSKDAVVLFAHGARDEEYAQPFHRMKALVQAQRPHVRVEVAFLEIMQPTLLAMIDRLHSDGVRHVNVAPMFLGPGGHVRRDLPELVAQAQRMYPGLTVRMLPTVLEVDALLEAIAGWIAGRSRAKPRG